MIARPYLRALCLAAALSASTGGARAEAITVFAAASLSTALDQAAAVWQAESGTEVVLSYAATSALARQIEAGAPADIFIAASRDWIDRLAAAGYLAEGSKRDLFGSRIVLIAPGAGHGVTAEIGPDFDMAAALGEGPLAMAFLESVPAGIYGKQALQSLGLWGAVAENVAQAENVRAALALVATGEAPLGVVYATDAVAETRVHVLGVFPKASHDPIIYPGAIVADSAVPEQAQAFLEWLTTPPARAIFLAQGFTLPRP